MPKRALEIVIFAVGFFATASAALAQSTTYYFFPNYEETDGLPTKYYSLAGGTTAVRRGSELFFLHQDHLSSTGLYFYNARQYNPATGSFISADSAQGPNRYAYVGGKSDYKKRSNRESRIQLSS